MKSSEQPGDSGALGIGALAGRFGLAPHVLRHWESVGLLDPARDAAGRRVYGAADVVRTAVILRAKEAGLSLDAIGTLLAAPGGAGDRREVLRRRAAALRADIARARARLELVECALGCAHPDMADCPDFRGVVAGALAGADGRCHHADGGARGTPPRGDAPWGSSTG
ncbi:MerR family transcriptional regulator [Streptomyces sp. NPDC126499]|uniref:MerR family transcriptional regulator n=1 Tax=Streptomyces sp. NPDC126499 TaxID=3155314 RepID=UPI003334736C